MWPKKAFYIDDIRLIFVAPFEFTFSENKKFNTRTKVEAAQNMHSIHVLHSYGRNVSCCEAPPPISSEQSPLLAFLSPSVT